VLINFSVELPLGTQGSYNHNFNSVSLLIQPIEVQACITRTKNAWTIYLSSLVHYLALTREYVPNFEGMQCVRLQHQASFSCLQIHGQAMIFLKCLSLKMNLINYFAVP